jgi:hypothetical protein
VVAADVEKTLRLVFARGVKADAVADALAERLEPKARRADHSLFRCTWRARACACACAFTHASLRARTQQLGKGSPALAAFKAAFSGATLNRGTVVTLSAARGGKLTAVVAGAAKAPIASPELCRALFDIYLGRDPVAPAAKEALGVALAARLCA